MAQAPAIENRIATGVPSIFLIYRVRAEAIEYDSNHWQSPSGIATANPAHFGDFGRFAPTEEFAQEPFFGISPRVGPLPICVRVIRQGESKAQTGCPVRDLSSLVAARELEEPRFSEYRFVDFEIVRNSIASENWLG
jgi:hypothetical protein